MKRTSRLALGAFVLALVALFVASILARRSEAPARSADLADAPDPATGALLIDLVDDASGRDEGELAGRIRAAIAPSPWPSDASALGVLLHDEANLYRLRPPPTEVGDVLRALRGDARVELVEVERSWGIPDHELGARAQAAARLPSGESSTRDRGDRFVPNDPYYPFQWHLDLIGMPSAWPRGRGAGAVVAVIDTGVAYRSEGGFAQAPDLGRTRFVEGYDFVRNDAHPDDEHGHGTHVAGTIAQSTHNGVGVAGVAPEATVMPLKVLDASGRGGWGAITAAIRYAADHGAHVINMSLGGGMPSRSVERAIRYAHGKGVVVIAAAGNASRRRVEYPARHEHVVAVGAVRLDRQLSFYSNYGEGLDLVAPGGDLRVDQNDDGMPDGVVQNTLVGGDPSRFDYLAWQGTSMATPHVAGVAALVHAAGVHDPDAVARVLAQSADDLGDARRFGSGLVQAEHALRLASQGAASIRGAVALGLAAWLFVAMRRRRLAVSGGWTAAVALVVAGGLGALPWHWFTSWQGSARWHGLGDPWRWLGDGAAALSKPSSLGLLGLSADAVGPGASLIVLSVLPAFAAVALGLHVPRLRTALVGLCLGTAAFLGVEALWPTLHVGLLPSVLVGPWLLANALASLALARLIASRER